MKWRHKHDVKWNKRTLLTRASSKYTINILRMTSQPRDLSRDISTKWAKVRGAPEGVLIFLKSSNQKHGKVLGLGTDPSQSLSLGSTPGNVSRQLSWCQLACDTIWIRCIHRSDVTTQPRSALTSTKAWKETRWDKVTEARRCGSPEGFGLLGRGQFWGRWRNQWTEAGSARNGHEEASGLWYWEGHSWCCGPGQVIVGPIHY